MTKKEDTQHASDTSDEVQAEALTKALNEVAGLIDNTPEGRKKVLLKKSLEDAATAEEEAELADLMKGDQEEDGDKMVKSVLGKMNDGEGISEALDASEYLSWHLGGTTEVMQQLATTIEKSASDNDHFNLQLAKAVVKIGEAVQSLVKSVDTLAEQPVSQGRAALNLPRAKAMQKSFAGAGDSGEELPRAQALDALEAMTAAAHANGTKNAPCGEPLLLATAKYEQSGLMSPQLENDVRAYLNRA